MLVRIHLLFIFGVCDLEQTFPIYCFYCCFFLVIDDSIDTIQIQSVADLRRRPEGAMAPPEGGNSN